MSRSRLITFSPERFLREWLAMLPADDPRLDRPAFVQAMLDVLSDQEWATTTSARVDAVAEFLLEIGDQPVRELFAEVVQSPGFMGAAQAAAWAFDPAAGLNAPGVRAMRRDALRDLVESMTEPLEAYLRRRRATRNREMRRLARRQPVLSDLQGSGDEEADTSELAARATEPEAGTLAAARECAQRVVNALDHRVPVCARRALIRFLTRSEGLTASAVARLEGTSPSAVTRAKKVLGGLAREEIRDLPADALPAFCEALMTELGRAA